MTNARVNGKTEARHSRTFHVCVHCTVYTADFYVEHGDRQENAKHKTFSRANGKLKFDCSRRSRCKLKHMRIKLYDNVKRLNWICVRISSEILSHSFYSYDQKFAYFTSILFDGNKIKLELDVCENRWYYVFIFPI